MITGYADPFVKNACWVATASFTRPNDTTAYAVGDGVTNSLTTPTPIVFTPVVRADAPRGYVRCAVAWKSTATTADANFRLYLFDQVPATVPIDNAPYAIPLADVSKLIGWINFTTYIAGSGCAFAAASGTAMVPDMQIFRLTTEPVIWGILQAQAAYAPGALEVFSFKLGLVID